MTPVLVVSVGDPAGIGPQISVRAAESIQKLHPEVRVVLVGDRLRINKLTTAPLGAYVNHLSAPATSCLDVHEPEDFPMGSASGAGGRQQLRQLNSAFELVKRLRSASVDAALVTGPMSKYAVTLGGTPFLGQTEHLAALDSRQSDAVTMMFLGPQLRVGLVTTHLPISAVGLAVTELRVKRTIQHLSEALVRLGVRQPNIVVTGLNPHAGESGLLGREDIDVIGSAMSSATPGAKVIGPVGAETAFRWAADRTVHGVVAMYHDQATIAAKLLDWGTSVNVTWGLSVVRTSVDHGVAYDAVDAGKTIDASPMAHAMLRAIELMT